MEAANQLPENIKNRQTNHTGLSVFKLLNITMIFYHTFLICQVLALGKKNKALRYKSEGCLK